MVSKFAILTNILLASGVLAFPSSSSRLKARFARRHANRQPTDALVEYANWAGVALTDSAGTFTTVTGTFTIPTLSSGSDNAVTVWVGTDGSSCRNGIFQSGVDLVVRSGNVVHVPWVEWYPDPVYYFSDFDISVGDEIRTTVTTSSSTSGKTVIENLRTNQTITKEVSSSHALCGQDAEWIAEDFMQDIPFSDFGMIKFTNATASGPGGRTYTPDGASMFYDIRRQDNATALTSTSISGNTVTIKRV